MAQRRKSLSEKDIYTIYAVFASIDEKFPRWTDKNAFIGSMTIDEMMELQSKLKNWLFGKKDPEEEEWDYDDDYSSNAPCDTYGMCAGTSCSHYYECHR